MKRSSELMQAFLLTTMLGYFLIAIAVLAVVEVDAPEAKEDPAFEVSHG